MEHPAFSEKVVVYNKFPYEQRVQFGVVLRNSSASQIRMSADNYLADLLSHLRLASSDNRPGTSIEWVKENTTDVTTYITEDLSSQVDPTQRLFHTTYSIVAGRNNTFYADNPAQVVLTVNGVKTTVESVDGENKEIILGSTPSAGDEVKVSYWYRTLVDPGIYVIDFTESNEFVVAPVYVVENKLLIERTTGLETSVSLGNNNIYTDSEEIYLQYANRNPGDNPLVLEKGTDYTIDYSNGQVTFLTTIAAGYQMLANYKWQTGNSYGPYTFEDYQEVHDAIRGVTICIGRRAQKDDRQLVLVSQFREQQARIYGGHWEMSLSLAVIAKDPIQMAEMSDHIVGTLWGERKNILEFEGITLNRVEPTGESEESFIETTGDLYYESSVDISVMTEWQRFVPYLFKIKRFSYEYEEFSPAMFSVVKFPTTAYEREI